MAPDGRRWTGATPLQTVSAEMRERVPAPVALARIIAAASEPDLADRHIQVGMFNGVSHCDDLVDQMELHIERLQAKLAERTPPFIFAPQRVREG